MKLILVWQEIQKEITTENSPDFEEFQNQVRQYFGLKGDIEISFVDADDDTVIVSDKYDLEYMISNSSDENPLKVQIEGTRCDEEKLQEKSELSSIKVEVQKEEPKKNQIEIEQEIIETIKNTVNDKIDELEKKIKLQKNISTETLPLDNLKEDHQDFGEFFEDRENNDFDFLIKENLKEKSQIKKSQKKQKNCALDLAIENSQKIQDLESKVDIIWNEFVNKMNNINKVVNKNNISYEQQIHQGYYCDNCKKENFSGKRFSCLECDDLDLCEDCEDEIEHAHPMIRYQQPVSTNKSQQMNALFKTQFIPKENSKDQKINITKALFGDRISEDFYEQFVNNFGACTNNMFIQKMQEILK